MANNKEKRLLADMHIHSEGSFDGTYSIDKIIGIANKNNVHTIAITDHNNFSAIKNFFVENNLPLLGCYHNINGINLIPGVEVTCVMPQILNNVGYKTKFHLLVYGARLDNYSPLAKLLELKHNNDELVDYGLLKLISSQNNFKVTTSSIKEYVIQKRGEQSGFGRFGAKSVIEFLKYNNISLAKSERELLKILKNAPTMERLELNMEDVIKLAHASGGICILAHPKKNLERTTQKSQAIKQMLKWGIDGFEILDNSMNQETFEVIMKECKSFNPKSKLLFTGGSDMHFESPELTIGKTYNYPITLASQQSFIDEIIRLDKARQIGILAVRNHPKPAEEIVETILRKYNQTEKDLEDKYFSAQIKFNKADDFYESVEENGYVKPEDYDTLEDYILAVLNFEATHEKTK